MKIYVINLDRSPERLERMSSILGDHRFERVPAIDGAQLPEAILAHWRQNAPHLTRGDVGCRLSHTKCWNIAARSSEPITVLEDDVYLGEGILPMLNTTDWIPPDADLVKLDTYLEPAVLDKARIDIGNRELSRLRGLHLASGGYVMTPSGRTKIARVSHTSFASIDRQLFDPAVPGVRELVTYQLLPAGCVQDAHLNRFGAIRLTSTIAASRGRPLKRSCGEDAAKDDKDDWRREFSGRRNADAACRLHQNGWWCHLSNPGSARPCAPCIASRSSYITR